MCSESRWRVLPTPEKNTGELEEAKGLEERNDSGVKQTHPYLDGVFADAVHDRSSGDLSRQGNCRQGWLRDIFCQA